MDGNTQQAPAVEDPSKQNGKSKRAKKDSGADGAPLIFKKPKIGEIEVTVKSTTAMLQDAMSEENVERILVDGDRDAKVTGIPRRERATPKLYVGPNGEYGVPMTVLTAALVEAGRSVKVGRGALSTAKTTKVYAVLTLLVEDEFIPFDKETLTPDRKHPTDPKKNVVDGWVPDMRRGQMSGSGGTKTAVGLCRPKFPTWGFTKLKARVNYSAVAGLTVAHVHQLFVIAGSLVGLGAYRPTCKGPFGTFEVADFVESKKPDKNGAEAVEPDDDGDSEGEDAS